MFGKAHFHQTCIYKNIKPPIKKKIKKCKPSNTNSIFPDRKFTLTLTSSYSLQLHRHTEGRHVFSPLLVFYSSTVYRVLKRLLFSLISNLFLQFLEFCLFDCCILFGSFLLFLCFFFCSPLKFELIYALCRSMFF